MYNWEQYLECREKSSNSRRQEESDNPCALLYCQEIIVKGEKQIKKQKESNWKSFIYQDQNLEKQTKQKSLYGNQQEDRIKPELYEII